MKHTAIIILALALGALSATWVHSSGHTLHLMSYWQDAPATTPVSLEAECMPVKEFADWGRQNWNEITQVGGGVGQIYVEEVGLTTAGSLVLWMNPTGGFAVTYEVGQLSCVLGYGGEWTGYLEGMI